MPTKGNARHSRRPKRQAPSLRARSRHPGKVKLRSSKAEEDLLQLVRTGVEKFILKKATVEEFLTMMRDVTEKEKAYAHQLTRSVFSRIVKEAIRKRKVRRSR